MDRNNISIFIDEEISPVAHFKALVSFDLDTRGMTNGQHVLKIVSHGQNRREGVQEIPFEVKNGPAVRIGGIREYAVVDGILPLIINAYNKAAQPGFIITKNWTMKKTKRALAVMLIASIYFLTQRTTIMAQKAPDYLVDSHLDKAVKEFLKPINAGPPLESLSKEDARNVLVTAQAAVKVDLSGIAESEKIITENGYAVKLNIVRPEGVTRKLPVFIFIHGGGWILGDYPTHKRLVRDLVVASGYAAVFVNYTPSPEAHYPQAINEIYTSAKWVSEHGDEINVDGRNMAVVGNSVGGNMSAVLCLMAKEKGGPKIKLQALLWPVTDADFNKPSWIEYSDQRFLTSPLMKWMWDQYTTIQVDRKEKYASPLQASVDDLKGLPPALIVVAENDILRDEGEAYARKLNEAGVPVTNLRFNGTIHDFGLLNGLAQTPQVKILIELTSAELKKYLQ